MNTENFYYPVKNEKSDELCFMERGLFNIPFVCYVVKEVPHRFGMEKQVVTNGDNCVVKLPILKDLKGLEVGKFYEITRKPQINFKNGGKRYPYDVVEIDEETYFYRSKLNTPYENVEENERPTRDVEFKTVFRFVHKIQTQKTKGEMMNEIENKPHNENIIGEMKMKAIENIKHEIEMCEKTGNYDSLMSCLNIIIKDDEMGKTVVKGGE